MVTTTLSLLAADAAAINTVAFSNHTGYGQFTGRRTDAPEIRDLYSGLVNSDLTDFDMLVSGYTGSAEAVQAVGEIARDLKKRRGDGFFWVMDPVMGDSGKLYVAEDIPGVYRGLLREADLVLPNDFEIGVLAEMEVRDLRSCVAAIEKLHMAHGVRNVVVTSMLLKRQDLTPAPLVPDRRYDEVLGVVGSTSRSDGSARPFLLTVPVLPVSFRGTGDMFAALMAVRLREAAVEGGVADKGRSWAPEDGVEATELPLAKAAGKVLASMYAILVKTAKRTEEELSRGEVMVREGEDQKKAEHLRRTKASEVRVVNFAEELKKPPVDGFEGVKFDALDVERILSRLPQP